MIDPNLVHLLVRHEGYRRHPYKCTAGKLTVGIGRNLDDVGISREEAEYLLVNDIRGAISDLNHHLPWFVSLPETVQHALIDMTINMGIVRLLEFRNMLGAIQAGNWEAARREAMDSRWARQVGTRAHDICAMFGP